MPENGDVTWDWMDDKGVCGRGELICVKLPPRLDGSERTIARLSRKYNRLMRLAQKYEARRGEETRSQGGQMGKVEVALRLSGTPTFAYVLHPPDTHVKHSLLDMIGKPPKGKPHPHVSVPGVTGI